MWQAGVVDASDKRAFRSLVLIPKYLAFKWRASKGTMKNAASSTIGVRIEMIESVILKVLSSQGRVLGFLQSLPGYSTLTSRQHYNGKSRLQTCSVFSQVDKWSDLMVRAWVWKKISHISHTSLYRHPLAVTKNNSYKRKKQLQPENENLFSKLWL